MSQLGQGSNSRLPTENENEFLPAGSSSYNQPGLINEQRRSFLLGNEDFFPMNSSLSANQAVIDPGAASKHEESLGAFSSKNQRIFQPQPEAEDEQNQFMLDHNSLAASINQGLTGHQSNLDSKITNNNPHLDFRDESNYFPQERSHFNNQQSKNNQLESEVEEYRENLVLNTENQSKEKSQSKIDALDASGRIEIEQKTEEKDINNENYSLQSELKDREEVKIQNSFEIPQSSLRQQPPKQSTPLNQSQDINMVSSHHSSSNKHKAESNLSKQMSILDQKSNFERESNKQLLPQNSNIASELKSEQPALHQTSGHQSKAESVKLKQNNLSGLINQQSNNLNQLSCNQPELDILKGVSKLDSKALQVQPQNKSLAIEQNSRQEKSGDGLLYEAKSSIINRIVVDPESLEKISNSQASIEQIELIAPKKEESVNRDLLESQVIKYDRSNHEISRSNIQSRQYKDIQNENKKQQWKDMELNQNDSRFLQPIEDSIRSMENKVAFVQVESDHLEETEKQYSNQQIEGQSIKPKQESANNNLSNIILDPFPANSNQNSQNIELDSSAPKKKQDSIKNSSFDSRTSGNRYEQSLSEFKRNQIRKLQERSSIDHLQSNFSEVRSKTNTEDNRQEADYINDFEQPSSKKGEYSLGENDLRHEGGQSMKNQGSNNSQRAQLLKQQPKMSQTLTKNRRIEHEIDQQSRKQSSIINQYELQSKQPSRLNDRIQNLPQPQAIKQPNFIEKKSPLEKQSFSEAHQNQSYLSSQSQKNQRSQDFIQHTFGVSEENKHYQINQSQADIMKNTPEYWEESEKNFSSKKQQIQTGNLLIENPDQNCQQNPSSLKKSLKESNKFSKQSSKNRNSDAYGLQTPDKEVKIFNSFPEEINYGERYLSEPREHEQYELKKNVIMTPHQKVKFERLSREKLYSQKEYLRTENKKERSSNRKESREDQIERIKALKEAQKKRLEKQLEKVSKELEEINQKQKKVERIYGQMERTETEEKTPKVSSHQSRHRKESEQFLKMIKQHRKLKEQEQLQFEDIDRNITNNLMELNKIRQETEDRKKEKKRIQIMERMKKNQLRKMNEMKQAKANNQYINQFKAEPHLSPQVPKSPPRQDYPSSVNQIKRPSRQQQQFLLNAGSKPIREQQHRSSKVTSIRSLHKKRQDDKYETRLD